MDLETGLYARSKVSFYSTSSQHCCDKDGIHHDLYHSIVKSEIRDSTLDECWRWYCGFLDSSIKRDWEQVLQAVIKGLDPTHPREATVWLQQICNVYKVLRAITEAIASRGDLSIDGITLQLMSGSGDVLRNGERDGVHGTTLDQNVVRQMVWCLVGLLTMLYDPKPQLHSQKLSLRLPTSGLRSSGFSRPGELSCGQQDIEKCRDPLHALLAQFGEVMPKVEVDQDYLASVDIDHINIAYVNFYTLKHVAKLDIEWVNTLNLHLQLDKRRGVLRLFRFPAFCRLAWTETEDSFMSQLFADHRRSQVNANLHTEHRFSDYLREVILSYRLLFGIDKHSRHAFKAELPAWRAGLPSDIIPQDLRNMDDPLLLLLCTTTTTESNNNTNSHHWFSRSSSLSQSPIPSNSLNDLLWWLRGEEKSGLYDLGDFPFLGRRLSELQRFSLKQKPKDWKSLFWVDRRDPQSFWNSWIAGVLLVIGGGTIFLQFWQLVFQVWGTVKQ